MAHVVLVLAVLPLAINCMLIAYDCNQSRLNLTSISLVTTPSCLDESRNVTVTKERVTITQTTLFRTVKYRRCLITAHNSAFRCGKVIDTAHQNSIFSDIVQVSEEECNDIIHKGRYRYSLGGNTVDITINHQFTMTAFVSRGYIRQGSCEPGTPFTRDGVFYDRPVVNTELHIRYSEGEGLVDLEENVVRIEGKSCNFQSGKCFDADLGYVFWEIPKPDCSGEDPKSLIYEGNAELVLEGNGNRYIQVTHSGYDFQILIRNETLYLCGILTWHTEHPRLYVTFLNKDQPSLNLRYPVKSQEVSMLNYINSKIVSSFRDVGGCFVAVFLGFALYRCLICMLICFVFLRLVRPSVGFFLSVSVCLVYAVASLVLVVCLVACRPVLVSAGVVGVDCYSVMFVEMGDRRIFLGLRSLFLIVVVFNLVFFVYLIA
uniref:Putative glycoprotein n=1 Tax=Anopheles darlingi TaxID=43151 RepID=A0A2M4CX55_ANODA